MPDAIARRALAGAVVRSLAATAAAALIAGGPATAVSRAQAVQWSIDRLGPDGFKALPPLEALIDGSDAAVVGSIVGTGGMTFRLVDNPYSEKKSVFGYATYRIAIDDVLFTRTPVGLPSLTAGTEMNLGQEVGRDSAARFVAGQIPVRGGDRCLLFLMARPHGWTLLQWHAQFRRTSGPVAAAENLGGPMFAAYVTPEWFGGSVSTTEQAGMTLPDWESFLTEVRRLGDRPSTLRPR